MEDRFAANDWLLTRKVLQHERCTKNQTTRKPTAWCIVSAKRDENSNKGCNLCEPAIYQLFQNL
jgi:hypothetical protein